MLQRADGARIVPEHFLRSWDPVTVFFQSDVGPQGGGPEDAPERFVKMTPEVAGAWQWLGARALQFRPADPWKPLRGVEIEAIGAASGADGARPPAAAAAGAGLDQSRRRGRACRRSRPYRADLRRSGRSRRADEASFDRAAPGAGLSAAGGQFLNAQDFAILPLAPGKRDAGQSYLVQLKNAVPDGRVAILRLKLSNEPGLDEPSFELRLQSAVPFTVIETRVAGAISNIQGSTGCCAARLRLTIPAPTPAIPRRRSAASPSPFRRKPEPLDITQARDALRISPPVDRLGVEADGTHLILTGRFLADTIYELSVAPGAMRDERKRPLEGPGLHAALRLRGRAPEPCLRRAAGHRRALRPAAGADARRRLRQG